MATSLANGCAETASHQSDEIKTPNANDINVKTAVVSDAGVVQKVPNEASELKADDDSKATDNVGEVAAQTHVNGEAKSETAAKKVDDSGAGDGPTKVEEKTTAEPVEPNTPASVKDIPPKTEKLSRPKQRDERMYNAYITKAHAQVREGNAVASTPEDQEKAVVKYAEMVSNLVHLMAAIGVGRNTAVRALAYLNSPEQPTPAQAIRQAKQDRREYNERKRAASHVSDNQDSKGEANADSKATTAVPSIQPASDESVSATSRTLKGSDEIGAEKDALSAKVNPVTQNPGATNNTAAINHDTLKSKGHKKNSFRHKWWSGKGRRHTSGKAKNGKNTQGVDTNLTKAVAGTPDTDVSTAVPIA